MMQFKCCTHCAGKFGKLSSGHRTEKVSFNSNTKEGQCQRMFKLPNNCTHFTHQQGNVQNPSSQALAGRELTTSNCATQAQKRKRNQRLNCQHSSDHGENKENPKKNTSISASLTMLKALTLWIKTNCGKLLKKWDYQTTLPVS